MSMPIFEDLPTDGEDDAFDGLYAQLGLDPAGGDYTIKVYRYTGGRGGAYLFDIGMGGDDSHVLERLRDEYGGGHFEVRVYQDQQIAKRRKVSVEAPKHQPQPKSDGLSGGAEIMAMMREMQAQNLAQMKELIGHVRQQPQPPPMDIEERMLARIATYKELFSQPAAPQSDTIEQFRLFMDFQRELGVGQGGNDDNWLGTLAPMVKDLIVASQTQPQRALPPGSHSQRERSSRGEPPAAQHDSGRAPTDAAAAPAPGSDPEPQPEQPPMNELQKGLSQLCMAATLKLDPENTAANLANNASDAYYEMLAELVAQADCVDRLVAVYQPVEQHRAWFEALRAALQAIFAADTDDEDADAADEPDERSSADRDAAGTMPARSAAQNDEEEEADAADKPAAPGNARQTPDR